MEREGERTTGGKSDRSERERERERGGGGGSDRYIDWRKIVYFLGLI